MKPLTLEQNQYNKEPPPEDILSLLHNGTSTRHNLQGICSFILNCGICSKVFQLQQQKKETRRSWDSLGLEGQSWLLVLNRKPWSAALARSCYLGAMAGSQPSDLWLSTDSWLTTGLQAILRPHHSHILQPIIHSSVTECLHWPGTAPGTKNTEANQIGDVPALMALTFSGDRQT